MTDRLRFALATVLLAASASSQDSQPAADSRPAEEDAPALTIAAMKRAEEGKLDEALELLEKARALRPEERVTTTNLSRMLGRRAVQRVKEGRIAEAEADLHRGVELAPEDGRNRVIRAGIWRERGEIFRAEAEIGRALVAEPGLAYAFEEFARCKYDDEDLASAKEALDTARKLDPVRGAKLAEFAAKLDREYEAEKDFDRHERGSFVVKADVKGLRGVAEHVLDLMDAAQRRARDLFAHEPLRRTVVVLYSGRDFAAVTGAHAWAGGLFDGKIRLPVRNFADTRRQVATTLTHEYMHFVVRDLTRHCPLWLNEGLAQYAEGMTGAAVRQALRGRELKRLGDLPASWFGEKNGAEVAIWYAQGLSFTSFLCDRSGPLFVKDLLLKLDGRTSFASAFTAQFGVPFEEMEDRWLESLR